MISMVYIDSSMPNEGLKLKIYSSATVQVVCLVNFALSPPSVTVGPVRVEIATLRRLLAGICS